MSRLGPFPPGVCYRRIGGKSASLLPLFPGFSTAVDDSALPASLRKAMDKCPKRKGVRVATEEEEELIASGELPGCVVAEVRTDGAGVGMQARRVRASCYGPLPARCFCYACIQQDGMAFL